MSGRKDDEERGVGAGRGRRTRPWARLRGPSEEADRLAMELRGWLDAAGLRLDDLMGELTPDHFESETVPSRTTVADRLAGVNLGWDFVEAVADVCSRDTAERERWTAAARPLFEAAERAKRSGARPHGGKRRGGGATAPDAAAGDAALAAELVGVQRQSLALSDQLFRALQRAAELEKARNDANHMVLILLTLVDKLQRDIRTLTAQRDRAHARSAGSDDVERLQERLQRSEAQRTQAESELARARAEREKADRLAEQQAEQVRQLADELARLRSVHHGPGAGPDTAGEEGLPVPAGEPQTVEADDVETALEKASRILDNGAERLDRLAEEIQEQSDELSGPDNSGSSAGAVPDTTDNRPATAPQAGPRKPADNSPDKAGGRTEEADRPDGPGDRGDGPGDRGDGPGDRGDGPGDRGDGVGDRGDGAGDRGDAPRERAAGPGDRGVGPEGRAAGPGDRVVGPDGRAVGRGDRAEGPEGREDEPYDPDPVLDQLTDVVHPGSARYEALIELIGRDKAPHTLVTAVEKLRAAGAFDTARRVLYQAGAGRPSRSLLACLALLPPEDARLVMAGVGAERPAGPLNEVVVALREEGHRVLAAAALRAAGLLRAVHSLPFLLWPIRLGSADTVLILKGVCERPPTEIAAVSRHLAAVGMRQESDFLAVISAREGGTAADGEPLGRWGQARWFPEQRPPSAPASRPTARTLTTRVHIKIPGSRPLPPIVVRRPQTPPGDEDRPQDSGPR
ncbi:hypothetical protein [Streptomyces sp. Caat 7-52]|uniref:hypothetical protein n=1 Tax=Streptomyces sp. Caat 7-52 TaxID=2949637 RepID=UPI0020365FC0|nr:hypothetical protein [Streptomyces sp. Caat 7-52]